MDREERHDKKDRKRTSGAADRSFDERDIMDVKRHKGDRDSSASRNKLNGGSAEGKSSSKEHPSSKESSYHVQKTRSADREKGRGHVDSRPDVSPTSSSSSGKKSSRKVIQSPEKDRTVVKKESKKSKHR